MTLSKLLKHSKLQFSHLKNEGDNMNFMIVKSENSCKVLSAMISM